MCAYSIEDDYEFDKILYETEVDLLDGSLETNKTNAYPLYKYSTVPLQYNSDLAIFLPNPENLGYRLPT